MSEPDDFSFSELRNKRARAQADAPPPQAESARPRDFPPPPSPADPSPAPKKDDEDDEDFELPLDPWRLVTALLTHWRLMLYAAGGCLVLGLVTGYFQTSYKIQVTLIQRDVTAKFQAGLEGESFKPHQLSVPTLVILMESSQLAERVSGKSRPPISGSQLKAITTVAAERNADLVGVTLAGKDKEALVDLANLFANEAVELTREQQLEELSRMNKKFQDMIHDKDREIETASKEMEAFRSTTKLVDPDAELQGYMKQLGEYVARVDFTKMEAEKVDLQIANWEAELAQQNPITQKLQTAKDKLASLLARYTEIWPEVQTTRREIAELERQVAEAGTNTIKLTAGNPNLVSNPAYQHLLESRMKKMALEKETSALQKSVEALQEKMNAISRESTRFALIKSKIDALKRSRLILTSRQDEAQQYQDNADGYYRVFQPVTLKDIDTMARWKKVIFFGLAGLLFGILAAASVIVVTEVADDRLKTAADVKRVTNLPILASLGDLDKLTPAEKETWAFRTWTALSGQLSRSANHGMVCGFISSTHGEGRSTWINLLVDAASQRGLRVLTISTRPSPSDLNEMEKAAEETEKQFGEAVAQALVASQPQLPSTAVTMTAQALAFPAEVSQKFTGPNPLPSAHIALPGWVWNLERRKQFQLALAHWRVIESMVLLVELPPASVPEAVLLAENLPQLIWLVDSGKPRARATREQLETLRHAKCRLVGAVLNHEPKSVLPL